MVVNQLIQTNEGMQLFDTPPKTIKMIRKTLDSKLESEEIPMMNAKQDNTHGQYIHIFSHYKFNDEPTVTYSKVPRIEIASTKNRNAKDGEVFYSTPITEITDSATRNNKSNQVKHKNFIFF